MMKKTGYQKKKIFKLRQAISAQKANYKTKSQRARIRPMGSPRKRVPFGASRFKSWRWRLFMLMVRIDLIQQVILYILLER